MVASLTTPQFSSAPSPYECADALGLDPRKRNSRELSAVCPDCSHGAGRRVKRAFSISLKPGKYGVCHCFRCGFSGHIQGVWKKRFGGTTPAPAAPWVQPAPARRKKKKPPVSMPEVWGVLSGLRPDYHDHLVRWGRRRGWPEEVVEQVAANPEFVYATLPTGDPETDRVCAAALNTFMHLEDGSWASFPLPVLTAHRDPQGRVRSFNRRHSELPPAAPSKTAYAPTDLTLYSGVRVIGQIPRAVDALLRGEPVYLVEGEPDFAVASALCSLDGRGYALGAPAHHWLPAVAAELRRAVLSLDQATTGPIIVVPHIGDHREVGLASAIEAAGELRRVAEVRLARPSHTKGDLADVLEANGKTQDVRDVLAQATVLYPAAVTLEYRRQELKHLVPRLLRSKGHHVVRGVTGLGKTRILLVALLELAAEIMDARIAYKRDGIVPMDAFLNYAVRQDKILLQYTVPTRELRTELFNWIQKLAHEKRLYSYATVSIREKKSRADGKDDPSFCRYPRETAAAAKTIAGGALDVCQRCNMFNAKTPAMSGCGFWKQIKKQHGEVTLEITTHASARAQDQLDDNGASRQLEQVEPDIRVIDESPVDTWYESIQTDMTQLAAGLNAGDLAVDDAAWRKLSDMVSNGASSTAFNSNFAHNDFAGGNGQTTGKRYMKDAAADPANRMKILEAAPDWRFWHRFAQAQKSGWAGVYAHKQKLTVIDRRVDTNSKWATVYADATITKPIAAALLPGCSWHELDMPLPATVKVIRTDWTAGKSNILRKDNKQTYRKWLATHKVYDGPDVLHITHKDLVEELRKHVVSNHVTYYGAPDATGSNRHENCTRVVADAWYVPNAAIDALAGKLAATDVQGHPAAYWKDAARDHLIDRRINQAIGRIRPFDGRKAELVIVSPHKDQRLTGLEADATVDGDVLAWTHDHQPHGNVLAAAIKQRVQEDKILVPALHMPRDADGHGTGHAMVANCKTIEASCVHWMSAPLSPAGLTSAQVHRQLIDFYARDWKELALDTGVFYYAVPTSAGGKPIAVLTREAVLASDVVPYMRELGVAWFRWRGKKVVVEDDTRLREATAAAAAALPPDQPLTTAAIAEAAGVSDRQVRRWIKILGVEVQDWLAGNTPSSDPSASAASSRMQPQKIFWVERPAAGLPVGAPTSPARSQRNVGVAPPDD